MSRGGVSLVGMLVIGDMVGLRAAIYVKPFFWDIISSILFDQEYMTLRWEIYGRIAACYT